ncbi:MAG: hypothetical protein ACHQF4_10165, partial [Sphingobacteriales bacterium]
MKKLLITLMFITSVGSVMAQATTDLNGVTFGFGAGYSYTFNHTYDYSLTTDGNHNLKLQSLSNGAFVISSVVMVKLSKLAFDPTNSKLVKQSKKGEYAVAQKNVDSYEKLSLKQSTDTNYSNLKSTAKKAAGVSFIDHLSINMALDLINISHNATINQRINGCLGLGYFITDNLQAAIFYDVSRVSQLRDYLVNSYQDKPIPNSSTTNYNSL